MKSEKLRTRCQVELLYFLKGFQLRKSKSEKQSYWNLQSTRVTSPSWPGRKTCRKYGLTNSSRSSSTKETLSWRLGLRFRFCATDRQQTWRNPSLAFAISARCPYLKKLLTSALQKLLSLVVWNRALATGILTRLKKQKSTSKSMKRNLVKVFWTNLGLESQNI